MIVIDDKNDASSVTSLASMTFNESQNKRPMQRFELRQAILAP